MTNLSVTNSFSNGAIVQASEHNTNYSDIVTYINNRNTGVSTWDGCSILSSSAVPLIVNNGSGANDIARFQDNGTNVLLVSDGGVITMGSQPCVRAYRGTSNQTWGTTGSNVKIQFNTESFDVKGEFDPTTNFRYTATVAGKYLVSTSILFSTSSAGVNEVSFFVNGAVVSNSSHYANTTSAYTIYLTDVLSLSASDYIEVNVKNGAGTATVTFGADKTFLTIYKIA